jgi:hypothetical protein
MSDSAVSDFLRSVELLKERREEEDEARSRDLEEQILQDKRERQARRAGNVSLPLPFSSIPSPILFRSRRPPAPPPDPTTTDTDTDTEPTPACLEPSSVDLLVLPTHSYITPTYPPLLPFPRLTAVLPPRRTCQIHLSPKILPRQHPLAHLAPSQPQSCRRRHRPLFPRPRILREPPIASCPFVGSHGQRHRLLRLADQGERLPVRLGRQANKSDLVLHGRRGPSLAAFVAEAAAVSRLGPPKESPSFDHGGRECGAVLHQPL